jgi:uncharacterized membrane protein YkvA (DUF1232 family)
MQNNPQREDRMRASAQQALLLIPNFVRLLYRLVRDQRVPLQEKALLLGTIAYVISPLDFLPDAIPFLGQIDDLLLVALILQRFMNSVNHSILLEHWAGRADLLLTIDKILAFTHYLLPSGVYNRIVKKAGQDYIDADFEVK